MIKKFDQITKQIKKLTFEVEWRDLISICQEGQTFQLHLNSTLIKAPFPSVLFVLPAILLLLTHFINIVRNCKGKKTTYSTRYNYLC